MHLFMGIPSPEISFIDLGPFRIHFYALFILSGIVIATILTDVRLRARGTPAGLFLDIALWAVPMGILGGRFFHVLTHPNDYFYQGADLLDIFKIWEGGLAIYGALILGAVGVFIGSRLAGVRFL